MKRKLVTFDWAMKKLLRSKANFDILEGFLSELLKEDIKIIEILENKAKEVSFQNSFNELKFKVTNQHKEIILIEVQYDRELDFCKKIYNISINYKNKKVYDFSRIDRFILININHFDLGFGEDYVYRGTTVLKGLHKNDILRLDSIQKKAFFCEQAKDILPEYYLLKVNNFNDVVKESLDEWIYLFKKCAIKKPVKASGLKKVKKVFDILALSERERYAYERYSDDLHYQASMFESTYVLGKNEARQEILEFKKTWL